MPKGYRFRFENCWLREKRCSDIVLESWTKTENLELQQRIGICAIELKNWGGRLVKDFKDRLRRSRERIRAVS